MHASPPLYTLAHVSEAVEWLERIQDKGSHVERSPTFRMWYADPIHRRAFDRCRELWDLLGQRHGVSGDSVHPDTRSNTRVYETPRIRGGLPDVGLGET
jgi:ferric-dicitrate binding protein FerR (iron transport regulator)